MTLQEIVKERKDSKRLKEGNLQQMVFDVASDMVKRFLEKIEPTLIDQTKKEITETILDLTKNVKKGDKGDSIIGKKGDKGERGARGEKGEEGAMGKPGLKGDNGEQGLQGLKGEDRKS